MMAQSDPWVTLGRDYASSLKIMRDPAREVYVALDGDTVLGFVILVMQGAFVGYIQSICVSPEARGRGVGSQLMAFAEEYIFKQSPNVFICVSSFNPDALRLYERLGYQLIGELENYIVDGHSELLLRKTVGPLREFQSE